MEFSEKSDIKVRAKSGTGTIAVACSYTGQLVLG